MKYFITISKNETLLFQESFVIGEPLERRRGALRRIKEIARAIKGNTVYSLLKDCPNADEITKDCSFTVCGEDDKMPDTSFIIESTDLTENELNDKKKVEWFCYQKNGYRTGGTITVRNTETNSFGPVLLGGLLNEFNLKEYLQ